MDKVLLVGNGINLVSDNGARWATLLNGLAGKPTTKHEEKVRKEKPFTLWFEEISSRSRKKDLKESMATALDKGLRPNSIHKEIVRLGFKNILTTNYDYNLEASTENKWKANMTAPETYYSLFRRRSFGSQHIWHIHGELNNVGSIMLGHEQYSGYIHKIRNFLTSGVATESKKRKGRPYLSKYSGKESPGKGDVENWVDIFLENEIHVVGFGFDYTENHLWNLITEKRRLRKKNKKAIGKVIFHRCSNQTQSISDEARLSILRALDVSVVDHIMDSYSEAYNSCIDGLSK